jgi:hypothetical protein
MSSARRDFRVSERVLDKLLSVTQGKNMTPLTSEAKRYLLSLTNSDEWVKIMRSLDAYIQSEGEEAMRQLFFVSSPKNGEMMNDEHIKNFEIYPETAGRYYPELFVTQLVYELGEASGGEIIDVETLLCGLASNEDVAAILGYKTGLLTALFSKGELVKAILKGLTRENHIAPSDRDDLLKKAFPDMKFSSEQDRVKASLVIFNFSTTIASYLSTLSDSLVLSVIKITKVNIEASNIRLRANIAVLSVIVHQYKKNGNNSFSIVALYETLTKGFKEENDFGKFLANLDDNICGTSFSFEMENGHNNPEAIKREMRRVHAIVKKDKEFYNYAMKEQSDE